MLAENPPSGRMPAGVPGKSRASPCGFVRVVGPHGCKNLTDRAELLLGQLLLDGLTLHGQKAGTDVIGKTLEEGDGVLNVFEVGSNFQPAAEAFPLVPGGAVFLVDGCR